MTRSLPERDWKCMRRLKADLLNNLCKRINKRSAEILTEDIDSEHKKYLSVFDHIHDSDRIVADCFDDWRRSTLMFKLYALHRHDLLKEEHIQQLSGETQQLLKELKTL